MTIDHMHLIVEELEVKAIANKTDDIHLSDIHLTIRVKSSESFEKLEKALQWHRDTLKYLESQLMPTDES